MDSGWSREIHYLPPLSVSLVRLGKWAASLREETALW